MRLHRKGLVGAVVALVLLSACDASPPVVGARTASPVESARATVAATPTAAATMAEDDAWRMVSAAVLSPTAVIRPSWLPPRIDLGTLTVTVDAAGPAYRVTYRTPQGGTISFVLGLTRSIAGSAIGTRVRGVSAVLEESSYDPATPLRFRVAWSEAPSAYAIEGQGVTGEEMLRVAWALTSTTPPPPPTHLYTREKTGACSTPGQSQEAVVRRLFALAASGDGAAVLDCYALEYIGENGTAFAAPWSRSGPLSELKVSPLDELAGRMRVGAIFTFEREPTLFFGPHKLLFYTVGWDEDRWRIFETATAVVRADMLRSAIGFVTTSPADAAARVRGAAIGIAPVLIPTWIPDGLIATASAWTDRFSIQYEDGRGRRLLIAIVVANPAPAPDPGKQETRLGFRADPNAIRQTYDTTDPGSDRFVMWRETATKVPSASDNFDVRCGCLPYFLSSRGLTADEFEKVIASLADH